MSDDLVQKNRQIQAQRDRLEPVFRQVGRIIVGQRTLIERLLIGLLTGGHVLLEGVPGLAKTLAVRTLARTLRLSFSRIQFTPDLLPADVIGTQIYNPRSGEFTVKRGPIFANVVLADEINRAPAKVQSALLEAMEEKQVTIGESSYPLEKPFLVLATQNPIEQEGTYPLPEAQVDRFMFKLVISYPNKKEEKEIMERMSTARTIDVKPVLKLEQIFELRAIMDQIYVDEKVKDYVLDLVFATREPEKYKMENLKSLISVGASPRASIMLIKAGKAHAFLRGRGYVTPDDIKQIGSDVLRHRLLVTYEAEAEELTSDHLVKKIFDQVEVP